MKKLEPLLFALLFLLPCSLLAQTDKEKAKEKGREAIKLMDGGQIQESLKLLEEAKLLDPENINYPYESAYAYYLKKDYKTAIGILESIKTHKDVSDFIFQLLGNAYDYENDEARAIATYEEGLKKFPKSGRLYLEMGNVQLNKKEYGKALPFYEKGIQIAPKFPSNYYWACKIFLSTKDEVWGMIYGELFMNLERNTKRTAEISKLLYETYKSEIKFTESGITISFNQNNVIDVNSLGKEKELKLPFGMIYEKNLTFAVMPEKAIDMDALHRIRQNFLKTYFDKGENKTYTNVLFDYQRTVMNAGHLEAYNHWILSKGDEEAFISWRDANKDSWDAFLKWFSDNGMQLDDNNRFYRTQY